MSALKEEPVLLDSVFVSMPTSRSKEKGQGLALLRLNSAGGVEMDEDQLQASGTENAEVLLLRASVLRKQNRLSEALAVCEKVLLQHPDHPIALNERGLVLLGLRRPVDAILSFDRATVADPDYIAALYNLANTLRNFGNPGPALKRYHRAYELNPNETNLLGDLILTRRHACDWSDAEEEEQQLAAAIRRAECSTTPFVTLAVLDSPELQRKAAETYSMLRHPAMDTSLPLPSGRKKGPIRLGYFSADFHSHPVAYLTAELFELHDRSCFEVFAFSFGPRLADSMRERLVAGFDRFIDVRDMDDASIAQRTRDLYIDIAIDLGGYTANSRTGIFAYRAAPLQVGYLGYLGTMGALYYDYLLADQIVLPPEDRQYYSESIAWLPCFRVNDRHRRIADTFPSRADEGLPESGFVFCSFNNNYKITPRVFDSWMRILSKVPDSVLWLFAANPLAADNLRREAERRGVAPERLVFAPHRDYADYLARYRLADLFLDTLPYNAGTTASDALWAGVPVLTRIGRTFAGRMAASLLHSVGLPELVTATDEDYVGLAVTLAGDSKQLAAFRHRLEASRDTSRLFDSKGFARQIESAYKTMQVRYLADLSPDDFHV